MLSDFDDAICLKKVLVIGSTTVAIIGISAFLPHKYYILGSHPNSHSHDIALKKRCWRYAKFLLLRLVYVCPSRVITILPRCLTSHVAIPSGFLFFLCKVSAGGILQVLVTGSRFLLKISATFRIFFFTPGGG